MTIIRFQQLSKALFSRRLCGGLRRRPGFRLGLEILEDRLTPTTWTGAGVLANSGGPDPHWSNASNWTDGLPTDSNAQLIFPDTNVSNFTSQNDLVTFSTQSILIKGSHSYTITGNAITLLQGGGLTVDSTTSHTVSLPLSLDGLGVNFIIIQPEATVTLNAANGAISGGGASALNKAGQGTLVLTSANPNFFGVINLDVGVLQVTNAQALGPTGETRISNDATAILQLSAGANNGTDVIRNSGKIRADTTLTWNGLIDLNFECASIQVDGAGNTFTLAGGLASHGGSSGGDLLKLGLGRLTLPASTNSNSFAGGEVSAGVLTFQGNYTIGSLFVDPSAAVEVQGGITVTTVAPSKLTLNGAGVGGAALLNVDGNNTWAGNIAVGVAGTIGATAGNLIVTGTISNATSLSHPCGTGTIAGVIGGLTKVGAGTVTLSANNTYTGGTTISAGVLQVGNGNATGALGSGAIANSASLVFNRTTNLTETDNISGTGSLTKNSSNTLTLSGNNIYSGATIINLGTLIALGGSGIGDQSAVSMMAASTIFKAQNAETIGSLASTFTGATVTLAVTGAGTLNTGGNNTSTTFAGLIGEIFVAGLTKSGTGRFVLSNANTYSGLTTVSAGELNLRSATATGTTGSAANGIVVANGAALELENSSGGLFTFAELLTLNGTGIGVTGGLLNVSGNNTWSGGMTFGSDCMMGSTAGTLTVTGNLGNISAANLLLMIGGPGNLVVGGNYVLHDELRNVSGTHSWTGNITLGSNSAIGASAGALTVTGNIDTAGFLLNVLGVGSTTFGGAGVLSGTGTLNKRDAGILILQGTGINTYSGMTFVHGGVLNIRKASALGLGAVTAGTVVSPLVGGVFARLEVEGGQGVTVTNEPLSLNGLGGTNQGALRNVSGTNTWTGAITLTGPSLVAVPLGQLILNGAISGAATASLTKNFGGILTLNGVSNYAGQTIVGAGKLEVNGTLTSSVLVNTSATLSRGGRVAGITTQGGIVNPGGQTNTLTSTSNVVFDANSTFSVNLFSFSPPTITNLAVTGTVNLGGATLNLSSAFSSQALPGTNFKIIDNDGTIDAVGGTFKNLLEGASFTITVFGPVINGTRLSQNQAYRVTYHGGDGNDVVVTYVGTASAFANRTVTTPIHEGEIATVTGTVVEPDSQDIFILEVAWGDGTPLESHTFPPGSGGQIVSVQHRYLYNPVIAGTGEYTISLAWHDQNGEGNTGTLVVTVKNITAEAASRFAHEMYATVLGREPDAAGQEFWVQQLQTGATRPQLAKVFWESPEHRGIQVDKFYQTYLHRAAEPAGREAWVNGLVAGLSETEVGCLFLTSPEYSVLHPTYETFLVGIYADVLGRAPDLEGLAFWQQIPQSDQARSAVGVGFLTSAEKHRRLVDDYYTTILKRDADAQGAESWLAELVSGRLSSEQVALGFLNSEEFFVRATK